MKKIISLNELETLFTKSYGADPISKKQWAEFYQDDVKFIDPTQEKNGLNSYIAAQEKLIKRCEDIYLETHAIAINGDTAFVEWTMGLKIFRKEFIYPGTTRLIFGESGKIKEHRDYFDFCGPTFSPVPLLGSFIRWLYKKFTN